MLGTMIHNLKRADRCALLCRRAHHQDRAVRRDHTTMKTIMRRVIIFKDTAEGWRTRDGELRAHEDGVSPDEFKDECRAT